MGFVIWIFLGQQHKNQPFASNDALWSPSRQSQTLDVSISIVMVGKQLFGSFVSW
jgi:hypothetical protein